LDRSTYSTIRRSSLKPRLLGHSGLNFIYVHLNRLIKARDLDVIYICGHGHGSPGMVANTWLEGTYSELYPSKIRDRHRAAMRSLPQLFHIANSAN
jgi:xylulose-5-phosphate/fructose-6-phosphate phosphoketolase